MPITSSIRARLQKRYDAFLPDDLQEWKAIGEAMRESGRVLRGNQFDALLLYASALEIAVDEFERICNENGIRSNG